MIVKQIVDEDFSNYKRPSMLIGFPTCSFKCEYELGEQVCQNGALATAKNVEITETEIFDRYMRNNLTSAIVCGGLEPFDSWEDLVGLVSTFRFNKILDDIVIYTGYYKEEIADKVKMLSMLPNIIIKFGRYVPNQQPHYDEILGVKLASDNQYAEKIS